MRFLRNVLDYSNPEKDLTDIVAELTKQMLEMTVLLLEMNERIKNLESERDAE